MRLRYILLLFGIFCFSKSYSIPTSIDTAKHHKSLDDITECCKKTAIVSVGGSTLAGCAAGAIGCSFIPFLGSVLCCLGGGLAGGAVGMLTSKPIAEVVCDL